MARLKKAIVRAGLETLYFSGSHLMMRPFVGGVGMVLTLHQVRPPRPDRFQPNRLLEVTPGFLERVAKSLRRSGMDIVPLDEMYRRMAARDFGSRFVCVTFDDGYRDTLHWAYPILKTYEIPFAVYVATSFPDRLGELWWLALEAVIARNDRVGLTIDGKDRWFECPNAEDKAALFEDIYWWLRRRRTEDELRAAVRNLCAVYHVDIARFCDELCMTWDEIGRLAADPLVTIGAHTVNHAILKKLSDDAVRSEMDVSRSVIEAALGKRPRHFAYPVGDATSAGPREFRIAAELGFKTAVTTRPGVLFAKHCDHLMALPRISLNGEYQQRRFLRVLMSGAATGMWNGFRRVNAA